MTQRRKPKQGYIYLLKDLNDPNGATYKFGCTTLEPEKRCKRVNYEKAGKFNFKLICSFKSFDIYSDESKLKWDILPAGMGALGEVFNSSIDEDLTCTSDVIERFLTVGGVIPKDSSIFDGVI